MLETVSWSGFQEHAAQWILLNRRERYEPGSGIHRLIMSTGGRIAGGGLFAVDVNEGRYPDCRWDVSVSDGGQAMRAMQSDAAAAKQRQNSAKIETKKREIQDTLERHFGPNRDCFTLTQAQGICGRTKYLPHVLLELTEKKVLTVSDEEKGAANQLAKCYRFSTDNQSEPPTSTKHENSHYEA